MSLKFKADEDKLGSEEERDIERWKFELS